MAIIGLLPARPVDSAVSLMIAMTVSNCPCGCWAERGKALTISLSSSSSWMPWGWNLNMLQTLICLKGSFLSLRYQLGTFLVVNKFRKTLRQYIKYGASCLSSISESCQLGVLLLKLLPSSLPVAGVKQHQSWYCFGCVVDSFGGIQNWWHFLV